MKTDKVNNKTLLVKRSVFVWMTVKTMKARLQMKKKKQQKA